jgi:hypothetical protein
MPLFNPPAGASHPDLATHDTLGLATDSELAGHATDTTAIHGITDTADLVESADLHAEDHDHDGAPTQKLAQANTHQSPDTDTGPTSLHHTIGAGANQSAAGNHAHALDFGEAGDISAEAFGDTAAAGATAEVADAGHRHAMPADPVTAHVAAGDPHPAYATDADVSAHPGDTADAHDASAISMAPAGGLASTDVQAGLEELDAEKSGTAHTHTHAATTGQTADQHHAQAHTHPAEGAVVVTHASTTGQTATDHHAAPAAGPDADIDVGATGDAGTAGTFARSGHGHRVDPDAGGGADATIDAAGTTGSATALARGGHGHKLATYGSAAAAVGTAGAGASGTAPSRGDHVHPTGAGTPSTQAFGDAAATGSGPAAAMTDHKHAMPADPVTAHAAASDPHTGYRLESADHSHASSGLQAGTIAHSATTGQTTDDHHAQSHSHASHTGIGANDHHSQAHTHPAEGAVVVTHASTTGQGINDHHAAGIPYNVQAPGSFTLPDTASQIQLQRLTLASTERFAAQGTARMKLQAEAVPFQGAFGLSSTVLLDDTYLLQYKRARLANSARITLVGTAELFMFDLAPVGRLVLAGKGG